jgi:hypothetical protein
LKDDIAKYTSDKVITIRLDSVEDYDQLKQVPVFKRCRMPAAHIRNHLARDYTNAKGLQKIGYTFVKTFAVIYLSRCGDHSRPPYSEQMIECEEGVVSRDEALDDEDSMISVDEILRRAKEVRLARPEGAKELGFRGASWVGVDGPGIREWATT